MWLHELAHHFSIRYGGREPQGVGARGDFTDCTYDPATFTRSIGRFYFGCS